MADFSTGVVVVQKVEKYIENTFIRVLLEINGLMLVHAPQLLCYVYIPQLIFRHVCKTAKSDRFIVSVHPSACNNSAPTERIFMHFHI